MLINPDSKVVNTRGCGPLMHYWYRRGFWENIFMSLFGVCIGIYMMFAFQRNRREFTQLRDEADDRKRIIRAHSTASLRSTNNNPSTSNKNPPKNNNQRYAYTGMHSSPSNGDDSDTNSSSIFYKPRSIPDPNA